MRPPRVCFTIRRVMLVVAIVALLLTGGEKEKDCLKQAESTVNESYRTLMVDLAARARERIEQDRQQLAALREQREHHQRLKEKYEWAAAHPWEWAGPDPPEPQYPQFGEPMPTGSFSMPPTRLQ
jgi:Sec-independent protein translocase protein TatA